MKQGLSDMALGCGMAVLAFLLCLVLLITGFWIGASL